MARGEYDSGMVKDIDPLLAELFCANCFYLDELLEVNFYSVLACNVKIGRLVRSRFRLRYENLC